MKLKTERQLRVDQGTTILLGYYNRSLDVVGPNLGVDPPEGMEIFVAWDALQHLHIGASSSCQVPFSLMYDAYTRGKALMERRLSEENTEQVIAFQPKYLGSYLAHASGGHRFVSIDKLRLKISGPN